MDAYSYMLAIINPFSKMCYVGLMSDKYDEKRLLRISVESNVFAFTLLLLFILTGDFILQDFFHIPIDALRMAGGLVIAKIGYDYVSKGMEAQIEAGDEGIAAVPLGTPLIAGPGAITMAITLSASRGWLVTIIATGLALLTNFILMVISIKLRSYAGHTVLEVFVKVVGIFILALGINMFMVGAENFLVQGFVRISSQT